MCLIISFPFPCFPPCFLFLSPTMTLVYMCLIISHSFSYFPICIRLFSFSFPCFTYVCFFSFSLLWSLSIPIPHPIPYFISLASLFVWGFMSRGFWRMSMVRGMRLLALRVVGWYAFRLLWNVILLWQRLLRMLSWRVHCPWACWLVVWPFCALRRWHSGVPREPR